MEESTNSVARLVKLLDDNGFNVVAIQTREPMAGPGEVHLSVNDRWKTEVTKDEGTQGS